MPITTNWFGRYIHGKDGQTHCGDPNCCWGPEGSRKGAIKLKRKRKVVAK
jgi:hypothetical protein